MHSTTGSETFLSSTSGRTADCERRVVVLASLSEKPMVDGSKFLRD